MHSSRMRTASSLPYRGSPRPRHPWTETPPPDQDTLGQRPPPPDRDPLDKDPTGQRPPRQRLPGQRPHGQRPKPQPVDRKPPVKTKLRLRAVIRYLLNYYGKGVPTAKADRPKEPRCDTSSSLL